MKKMKLISMALAATLAMGNVTAFACTGVYVGKDVSTDGTTIIARSEDISPSDYPKLHYVVDRVENQSGRFIEDINGFKYPLPATTYQYTMMSDYATAGDGVYSAVCSNEYGVSVTGTVSASGCEAWEAVDPYIENGLREAALPELVASCSTTAREAVEVLLSVVDEYGSAQGNIIMIADQNEAWIVEIYGGHEYAAMKMPTDAVAVYGNQFMIGCVDATDTENYIFSENLFTKIDEAGLAVIENGQYHLAKSICDETRTDGSNMRTWIGHKLLAPSTVGEYDTNTFYELFYAPDTKVELDDVMAIYRNRYEGTQYDASLPGNEDIRTIGQSTTPETHIVQIHADYPAESAAVTWIAPGGAEHSVFLPEFSGITDTVAEWKKDSTIYTDDSLYWTFKQICALADTNRALYSQGVEDFWTLQEAIMQSQMEAAGKTAKEKYAQSETVGDEYVTAYTAQLAEKQMANAEHLYTELITTLTHNAGLKSTGTPIVFEATTALKEAATYKGYTVSWNQTEKTITLKKDGTTITVKGGSAEATKNGQTVALSTASYIKDGVLYAPMSFVQDVL